MSVVAQPHPVARVRREVIDMFRKRRQKDVIDAIDCRLAALNTSYTDGRIVEQRCGSGASATRNRVLLGGSAKSPRILAACTVAPGNGCGRLELDLGTPATTQ